jgi:hypothetical protein
VFADGVIAGYLLREIHTDGPAIVGRYDHWVFLQGYELLQTDEHGVHVVPNGESPGTTADFYAFADQQPWLGGAVVQYAPETVADTCLLGGVGCGFVFP